MSTRKFILIFLCIIQLFLIQNHAFCIDFESVSEVRTNKIEESAISPQVFLDQTTWKLKKNTTLEFVLNDGVVRKVIQNNTILLDSCNQFYVHDAILSEDQNYLLLKIHKNNGEYSHLKVVVWVNGVGYELNKNVVEVDKVGAGDTVTGLLNVIGNGVTLKAYILVLRRNSELKSSNQITHNVEIWNLNSNEFEAKIIRLRKFPN